MGDRRHAVVCDDDPIICSVASFLLRNEGFDVTIVGTGAALARLLDDDDPPVVVVLDRELPDASGDELAGVVKAAVPACRIIMFSGRNDPPDRVDQLFARIPKAGTEELAAAIRRAAAE